MSSNRLSSKKERRTKFILEMIKNALQPYEMSEKYEEETIGEFENETEKGYFFRFYDLIENPKLILDLACGDGRHTCRLCEKAQFVVGVDLSNRNIAKAAIKTHDNVNVSFVKASLFNLPFVPFSFDGIWFSQAFEYVPPDFRREFVLQLRNMLRDGAILYMSVETWQYSRLVTTIRELLGDFMLFIYWKFVKGKPLLWGEFLYNLPSTVECKGWHYHVHTSRRKTNNLLKGLDFALISQSLCNGYVYLICKK